jgi:Carboxypeptidase regulatory-like domain
MFHRTVFAAALALAVCTTAVAQFEAGSVVGTVKDPTGLSMPNVVVEIRSLATNVSRQSLTSAAGDFDFVAVQPGKYALTAKRPGFKETTQNFDVAVSQRVELNLSMEVGAASQSVTVEASALAVETASSDMSNVRTRQQVVDLPLNNRNFTQLVQLAPGVNSIGNSTNISNGGYTAGRGTSGAVINGNSSDIGLYMFDGIQGVDADANVLVFYPPVDAIQEFKVQTSAAPASYGGSPSIVNVTFRSGSNDVHGTLYEFVRNSAFDAKNFFDSPTNPIPPFRMNEFGANLGGPVVIPHLFNGRDKLFFFADYEGKRVSQAQTYISTVPIPDFRNGDFSALRTVVRGPGSTQPLPNNQVPAQQIDPTSAKLMKLYPLPNIPGSGQVSNFLYNGPLLNNIDQGDVRVDYRTPKSSLFGRFSKEDAVTTNPGFLPAPAIGGGPGYPGDTLAPGTQVVLGYGRSIGANKYYELRLGFSRLLEFIIDEDSKRGNVAEQFGIPNANLGGPGMSTISVSGMAALGDGNGNVTKVNNIYEVNQALSWIKARHEFKFGFNFMSARFAFFTPPKPVGSFNFNAGYTGFGLADFLYGRPISSQYDVTKFFDLKRYRPVFYIQDNWRVTSKLTLNLGLRNEMVTSWKERHNRLAIFDPSNGGNLVPVGTPGFPKDTVTDGHLTNLGPRVGFAYSLTPKTVIRGGFGIFYAYQTYNSNPQSKNAPFNGSVVVSNATGEAGFAAAVPISAGLPAARPDLFPPAGTAFQVFQREYPNPSANEWNFNIQRQFSGHDTLSVAYVAQNGVHILINPNINQAVPGPGAVASRRAYPNLADGTMNCTCANSSFNSLQVTYINRLASGLDFQGAYTYAHSLDNSSGNSNAVGIQNPFNLRLYRGNSDFDIRHNLVLSWSYALPFGRGKKFAGDAHGVMQQVIGGWRLNSIDSFISGAPFTPVMVSSLLNSGSAGQWPNRTGSGHVDNPTIRAWFNPADFVSPGNYIYGNSGRNILFGPGTKQLDLSLFKDFMFSENAGRRLQFRAEAFNFLNTPQFNNPNAQIGNPAAGTITSAGSPLLFKRTSRQIQLALKLYW